MEESPKKSTRSSLTRRILIAMAAGALTGVGINLLGRFLGEENAFHLFVIEYGAEGLFAIVGQGFLRLLTVLVVPLVFVSLVCGTAALEDVRRLGRIGVKALGLYLLTTALAITLGLLVAIGLQPGAGFGLQTDLEFQAREAPPLTEVVIQLFPRNAIAAMAEGQMLQLIIFSMLLGLAISMAGTSGKKLLGAFSDWNEVILKLVGIIMILAPYGVFALIARTFATEGLEAFRPLLAYFLIVLGVLLLHGFGTYSVLLRLIGNLNPLNFLRKMREVQLFAFSTASSNATIPITLTTVEKRLGVSNPVASFTVPLGATINMDGTAIMQGVATVFIAQAYGIELNFFQYLTVVLTATLASIGTAGVPGVGLIMLSMVLTQVGLPVEGIALIIGIDRLLDMVRTAVNVTGDAMVSCLVGQSESELDKTVFDAPADADKAEGSG